MNAKTLLALGVLASALPLGVSAADSGRIRLSLVGANTMIQVVGDPEEDWRIETSTNLAASTPLTSFGTLLSARPTRPPARRQGMLRSPALHDGDGAYFYSPEPKISEGRSVTMDADGNILVCESDWGYVRRIRFQRAPPD